MADVNQEWRNLVSRLGMQTRESDIEPTAEMLEEYFNKASQIAMGLDIHCDPTNPALDMLQVIYGISLARLNGENVSTEDLTTSSSLVSMLHGIA